MVQIPMLGLHMSICPRAAVVLRRMQSVQGRTCRHTPNRLLPSHVLVQTENAPNPFSAGLTALSPTS